MIRLADPNYPAQVVYGHRLADTELIVSIGPGTLARALQPERSPEWQAYVNDRDVEVVILEQHACPARARLREAELIAERRPILNRHHLQGPHRQVLRGSPSRGSAAPAGQRTATVARPLNERRSGGTRIAPADRKTDPRMSRGRSMFWLRIFIIWTATVTELAVSSLEPRALACTRRGFGGSTVGHSPPVPHPRYAPGNSSVQVSGLEHQVPVSSGSPRRTICSRFCHVDGHSRLCGLPK